MLPPPSCRPPPRMRPCQGDPVEAAGVGVRGKEDRQLSRLLFSSQKRPRHGLNGEDTPLWQVRVTPSRISLLLNQETQNHLE